MPRVALSAELEPRKLLIEAGSMDPQELCGLCLVALRHFQGLKDSLPFRCQVQGHVTHG